MIMEMRPKLEPIVANVLRFLRLRAMPKTPKIKVAMARKKDRMLTIGIQEPRSARAPKMMARIPKSFCSFCFMCEFLISSKLNSYLCEIVFIIDKIRAYVNFCLDSSQGNFFLDILFENDKIVLMKT